MPPPDESAPPIAAAAPRASRWTAFATRDFWNLWFVGLVLFTVRWIEMLAMGVFVYRLTGSPFIVAILTMLRLLPMALFGAFLGEIADRMERRTALLVVILILFATSTTLAVLAQLGALAVWHLALATFVNGSTWASDNPVRRILLGEVVGAANMGRAMSIDIGTNNASRMIGPTIGGLMLANEGIAGVFMLSMACYAVAAVAAWRIGHRTAIRAGAGGSFFANMAEGLTIVRHDRRIIGTLVITVIFNVFGWPFTSMIPVIGQDNLLLDAKGIGFLASMDGFGAFLGAMAIAFVAKPRHYARIYVYGTALYLVLLPVFALVPDALVGGAALLFTGVTGAGFMTMQSTLIFVLVPPALRSRVFGVLSVCIGLGPLGFIHVGLLADAWGAPLATAAIGLEGLVILALTTKYWREMLRI